MNIHHHASGLLLAVSIFGVPGIANSQGPEELSSNAAIKGLAISVRADRDSYQVGEDILLSVVVSNTSPQPIKLTRIGGVIGTYKPVVKDASGKALQLRTSKHPKSSGSRPTARSMRLRFELEPAESIESTVSLSQWLKIADVGTYRLTLFRNPMSSREASVASNTIEIQVVPKSLPSKRGEKK